MADVKKLVCGRYRLKGMIGEGTLSEVHKAMDTRTQKMVALKLLVDGDHKTSERQLREVRNLCSMEHPNVAKVFEVGQDGERAFVVMELLEGQTMYELLKVQGELPWARTKPILEQVCDAILAYHEAGMIHLDVKPGKIFLVEDGQVRLLRSGMVKYLVDDVKDHLTDEEMVFGTFEYMSPERTVGEYDSIDLRADVYSLGVTAYRMLCNAFPLEADNLFKMMDAIRNESPMPPSLRRPELDIPSAAEALVMKALEKDPSLRFQDIREMREAVSKA